MLNASTRAASLGSSPCIAVCFVAFFRPEIFLNNAAGQEGKFKSVKVWSPAKTAGHPNHGRRSLISVCASVLDCTARIGAARGITRGLQKATAPTFSP